MGTLLVGVTLFVLITVWMVNGMINHNRAKKVYRKGKHYGY